MKKVLSVILVCALALALLTSSAFAVDLTAFNENAKLFGLDPLDPSDGQVSSDSGMTATLFYAGGCYIVFVEAGGLLAAIAVQGEGDNLLAYTFAAACTYDTDPANRDTNISAIRNRMMPRVR